MCVDASTGCDDTLRALVGRAVERDPDAWEQLYRRSYRKLYGYALRRVFDRHAADDVVSETMTRALDNIDRFTWRGGGFDAWLYGIARNVVFEFSRGRARIVVSVDDDRATTERGPEEQAMLDDDAAAVRWAFARLGADERELLELRVQGGLSSEEVGEVLGKRPGAVRMAQARALRRLRTILEEAFDAR